MLNQAIEHNGPALVDVVVNRQELLIPPSINLAQINGFTLYMIKAVLNGRGDEIVDLAKTNLLLSSHVRCEIVFKFIITSTIALIWFFRNQVSFDIAHLRVDQA